MYSDLVCPPGMSSCCAHLSIFLSLSLAFILTFYSNENSELFLPDGAPRIYFLSISGLSSPMWFTNKPSQVKDASSRAGAFTLALGC